MEFNLSPADKSKRAEFQTQEFCHQQLRVKKNNAGKLNQSS